jgi:hypothetical protein
MIHPDSWFVFEERFFVCSKLIYSSRPKLCPGHGLPRLPGSYSHTQAVLQTDTLFYVHCAAPIRLRDNIWNIPSGTLRNRALTTILGRRSVVNKSYLKSDLFKFALKDALRANQGQAIRGRLLRCQYTALEPQREILAKQAINTKCLELNPA